MKDECKRSFGERPSIFSRKFGSPLKKWGNDMAVENPKIANDYLKDCLTCILVFENKYNVDYRSIKINVQCVPVSKVKLTISS